MAKINTTFSFQDQITAQLNNLNKTLAGVLDAVKSTQNGMKGANKEIENTAESTKKAEGGLSALSEKLLKFNLVVSTFNTVKGAIDGVTGAVGGLNAMWQAQQDSEARLSAVMQARFHSDAQGVAEMTQYLDEFSKGSAYNKTMLTNAAQELGTYIESADTLKGLLPMLTSMSQQAGINNEQGLMSMATMIGKVMGGDMGGLSKRGWQFSESEKEAFKTMSEMERLNFLVKTAKENIGEQDQAIAGMMANLAKQRNLENLQMKLGGLFNPMFDAIGQAQIAFKTEFYERIIPIVERIAPVFDQMITGVTVATARIHTAIDKIVERVQNSIKRIKFSLNFNDIASIVLPMIASLKENIRGIANFIQEVIRVSYNAIELAILKIITAVRTVYDGFYSVMDGIRNNLNSIAIAVTTAGAIIIASITAVGVAYLWTSRVAIAGYINHLKRGIVIMIIHAKQAVVSAVQTAVAWAAANAPLLITIGIIIALIAAIGLVLAHSQKTFPAIAGFIWQIAGVAKAVGNNIKVAFLTGIEAVINGFIKLRSKVADVLYTIVDKALSAAEKIAPIIDKAFPDFSEKLSGMRATIAELKDANANKKPFEFKNKGEFMDIGGTAEQYRAIGAMKGIKASRDFQQWTNDKLQGLKNLIPKKSGLEGVDGLNKDGKNVEDMVKDALDEKFNTDGSGALKTSDQGVIEISNDYKELLTSAATRRFNATFKSVAPTVNVGGVVFNDTGSFDTFVNQLSDGIQEVSGNSLRAG